MRIKELQLQNIGPFKEAKLTFLNEEELEFPPVTYITGENGTGKSIIIDAIRALCRGDVINRVNREHIHGIERDITASTNFLINAKVNLNKETFEFTSVKKGRANTIVTNNINFNNLFISSHKSLTRDFQKNFIFDYWTPKLSSGAFTIDKITSPDPDKYLDNVLSGSYKNTDVTEIITFLDYLRGSGNPKEAKLGAGLYQLLEKIINQSITQGALAYVSRMELKPIISIGHKEYALDKLSSGNLYLIQRFTSLVRQVYAVCTLNDIPIEDYQSIKGVLLIDEAENHLHPKWQKVFIQNIQKLFPRLQIIVSTHSPFIVSSAENYRVYVCKSKVDYSVVEDETDHYANKPIEEILMSPLFDTRNFNAEISQLLEERKKAKEECNLEEAKNIEAKLLAINPQYFEYLTLDSVLKSIKNERN